MSESGTKQPQNGRRWPKSYGRRFLVSLVIAGPAVLLAHVVGFAVGALVWARPLEWVLTMAALVTPMSIVVFAAGLAAAARPDTPLPAFLGAKGSRT